ncbi:MAG: response regulator [Nitrospirae bacterium]|nr:response regulator [Nitrospirota bacterium]
MTEGFKILLIEDNPGDTDLIEEMLTAAKVSFELTRVDRLSDGIEQIQSEDYSVILLDLGLPDSQGLETLTKLNKNGPKAPIIVLTGLADETIGTQAVKDGAQDYLIKGQIDHKLLSRAIKHAIERAKLEFEREQYFKFFQTSTDLMCIADPNGSFIKTNPSCSETLGYTEAELVSKPFIEFVHPDDKQATLDEMARQLRIGYSLNFENRYVHKDGSLRWLSWRAIYNKDDGITYATARDITERRSLENQLRHAQKLEGIGQLAGGIAHDFNNVLNAVVGYAGLLQMQMDAADPLRKYVDEIASAGMRGAALTQQILAFSRKQVLDMKPANLNEIIKGIEKMLHRLVREDISIEISLFGKDLIVLADASQIDQILINLATNARDAMPSGGRLNISTEFFVMHDDYVVMHGYGKAGEYALLRVSDTGCGMDADTLSRIFEPFFTTKEVGKGTGLGLAVVHGLVKQHNGFINVYSEVGNGTVFKIFLPLTKYAEEETEEKPVAGITVGTETILIAEDDAPLRRLSSVVMRNAGYTVIEAVDGEDALRKFIDNREKIGLVILDGIMPKKNGREVYDEIHRIGPDMKAIFMSGYAEEIFTHGGIPDKGVVFISKPVKPDDLLRKVREVLDSH